MASKIGNCPIQFFPMLGPDNIDGYDATAPFITDGLASEGNTEMSSGGPYQVQAFLEGSNGNAKFTIEQSSDGLNWDTVIDGIDLIIPSNDSITYEDIVFTGAFIRINYNNDLNTSGTVTFILTQK